MKINRKRFCPERVEQLSNCEIFVFGSNIEGMHIGGAAKVAYEKFGAEWGIGDGPTGRCYAIPTMHGGPEEIRPYVDEFITFAKDHPELTFLVTEIGCGIAGFTPEEIAPLFKNAIEIENIHLPERFWKVIKK